jgi:O-antigen/teichoic acid export membrane protein
MPEELTSTQVKDRAMSGVIALISRTFIIQIITFFATLILTIYLDASIYGVFYLVGSVINFLSYFSDVGLAAALIQKKEAVTDQDLKTTFTIQQILVLTLISIILLFSPKISEFYALDSAGTYLLFAMLISFFLSSLKTIPSIMLEREIRFEKLVIPHVLETLTYNAVAVYMAINGFGITSFSVAVVARGVVGLVAIYFVYPWIPKFGISFGSLKGLLRFGIPYQVNSFLSVMKDDGMNIVLSRVIGTTGLGYLGWASRWAGLPLRLLMDNLTKVSFPAFSRLQHDPERLKKAVEYNLKYLTLIIFPILLVMLFMARPLIDIIPRYEKWLPALIPLYIYIYNSAWASISSSLTNLLNAIGKIHLTFRLMIMWTSMTWIFMPIMGLRYGYIGVSYAIAIIATSSVVTLIVARHQSHFSLRSSFQSTIIVSLLISAYLSIAYRYVSDFYSLVISLALALIIYVALIIKLEGHDLIPRAVALVKKYAR